MNGQMIINLSIAGFLLVLFHDKIFAFIKSKTPIFNGTIDKLEGPLHAAKDYIFEKSNTVVTDVDELIAQRDAINAALSKIVGKVKDEK